MISLSSSTVRHLLFLVLVASCLFFFGLGKLPLLEPDEGRNAEVAREMLASGDWVTPHFNTLTYLDKPAVFFWLVAVSFRAWGVSEWAARFPSALMALATLLLTWVLAGRMFDRSAGLRAGIILATSPLVFALSRFVTFDMTLTFFVTLAMASFWLVGAGGARSPWLDALLFGSMGLATITKGPVGFLLPLLSILAYQAVRRRLHELKKLRWGLGVAVFLVTALPWFVAVSVRHPDFPRYALWRESLVRFATGRAHRTGSFAYYIPVYLWGFFPWSFLLPFAGWNRLKRWRELHEESRNPIVFLLVWAGVVFLFFSISQSKLPAYFLPAVIPLSILMAQVWAEVGSREALGPTDWLTAGLAALLGLGLVIALASHLVLLGAMQAWMARRLPPSVGASLKPCLLYSGLILAALAIVGRNLAQRARGSRLSAMAFALLALTVPLLVVRWLMPLRTYAASASSRRLAEAILASPERDLPLYGYYYFRTSLPFYLRRPVGLVTADASEMTSNYVAERLSELRRDARLAGPSASDDRMGLLPTPVLIEVTDLKVLSSRQPTLVLARNAQVGQLARLFAGLEPLWAGWDYSVWEIPCPKSETRR